MLAGTGSRGCSLGTCRRSIQGRLWGLPECLIQWTYLREVAGPVDKGRDSCLDRTVSGRGAGLVVFPGPGRQGVVAHLAGWLT